MPHMGWIDTKTLPSNSNHSLSTILIDTINDHTLSQIVDHPTRKENLLDLFFTSNPSLINRVITVPPLTPDADHDIVFIDVNTRATVPKKKPSTKFLYDKANWDSMKVSMNNYCLPQKPVQEQWNHLENFLQNLMRKYIPSKVSRLGMSRIDGYSYTKRFLPCNESESGFRIFEKKTCPTHLKTEKSNVSSRRNFPLGLRTVYSVKRVLDLPLNAFQYTATGACYVSRHCRRQGKFRAS